jgi:L-threonylcarbamoyladenylate synthase
MVRVLGPSDPEGAVAEAVAVLDRGGLVAFPTETVYGLGADASSAAAVDRIFEAKGRPRGHPLIAHVADVAQARSAAAVWPEAAEALADAFWPGPLTLVVARGSAVVAETAGGLATVGLRVPDHRLTLAVLERFGRAVAGPSANRFGAVSPTSAQHVVDDLGDRVDLVLDGGPTRVGLESTIVDVSGPTPQLLRPGGIAEVEVEAVLGAPLVDGRSGPSRASGMLASHYAPSVAVELIAPDDVDGRLVEAARAGRKVGLVAPFDHDHDPSWCLPADAAGYGARLYATLRAADRQPIESLLVVGPQRGPLRSAVIDRLTKAAAPR